MNAVHQVLNPDDCELLDIADLPEHTGNDVIGVDARIRELLSSAFTTEQVAEALSISISSVHRRRRHRALWAINHAHMWRFPAAQFIVDDGWPVRQVPGLDLVFKELPADLHPLAVDGFLHTPQPDLLIGHKLVIPLDWLRAGRPAQAVLTCAATLDWYS